QVSVSQQMGLLRRHLLEPELENYWSTFLDLDGDRNCEFIFGEKREAEYFCCCLQALAEAAGAIEKEPDSAAGLPTARSVAPNAGALSRDPEAFMRALSQALDNTVVSLQTDEDDLDLRA
ncbi:unnamed protein product, partial [Effrenium voratum]